MHFYIYEDETPKGHSAKKDYSISYGNNRIKLDCSERNKDNFSGKKGKDQGLVLRQKI